MADLKNTVIDDAGFLQLPVGTTGQRPTPANGQMRFNSTTGKAEFYNGSVGDWIGTASLGVVATGGTVYDVDVEGTTYRVHVFTSTGNSTFTVSKGGTVEYLIVAGGGGGGGTGAGGAGAGGVLTGATTVTPQNYTVTVGTGGNGGRAWSNSPQAGTNGGNSSAFGLTATGGGRTNRGAGGSNGGSGGGGDRGANPGQGTAGQGNRGGFAPFGNGQGTGGGGGAGSVGQDAVSAAIAGAGGGGLMSNITGIAAFYAGGGGGGIYGTSRIAGLGGLGGGGAGGRTNVANTGDGARDGLENTAGGGGGGGYTSSGPNLQGGGNGGSGIVIVRYPLRQANPIVAAGKTIGDGLVLDLDFAKPTVYSGSGTVVTDSRLNGISGTLVNSPVFADPRTHRSSFRFNSVSGQRVTLPFLAPQTNAPLSAFFWVYFNGLVITSNGIWGHNSAGGNVHFEQRVGATRLRLQDITNNNLDPCPTDVWTYIGFTSTGSNHVFYINGVIRQQWTGTTGTMFGSPEWHTLGDSSNTSRPWNGKIATASIYNITLSPSEVQQNFNATRWRFGV